jgi:hypothetical protein
MSASAKFIDLRTYKYDQATAREVVTTAAMLSGLEVRNVSRDGLMLVGDPAKIVVFCHLNPGPELPIIGYNPNQAGDTDDDI